MDIQIAKGESHFCPWFAPMAVADLFFSCHCKDRFFPSFCFHPFFFFFFVSPTEDFFQATLSCLLTAVIQPESSFPETENTGGERTVCELSHAKYNNDKIKLFTNW